jgi:hypothetical protein
MSCGHALFGEVKGVKSAAQAERHHKNGNRCPNDGSAGNRGLVRGCRESEFGGLSAVGAIGGHADGVGGEFDVAAAVGAFAFQVLNPAHLLEINI